MAFSTNQLAVLALVLVLGWLLGLLSRSGGGKYRQEAIEQRRLREQAEARIAASNARIAELERQGVVGHPVTGATAASIGAAASGGRDDLALIRGVGRSGETRLNDLGIHRYRQLSELSDAGVSELEGRLGAEPGLIMRDQWREQAALLASGKLKEHADRFG